MKKTKYSLTASLSLLIPFLFCMPVHAEDTPKSELDVQYMKQNEEHALIQVNAKELNAIRLPDGNIIHQQKIDYITSRNGNYGFSDVAKSPERMENNVNIADLRKELLVTNKTQVKLKLKTQDLLSGNHEMRFKNDNGNWSVFEPFKQDKDWNLLDEEGIRTVSVQYKDLAGNISDDVFDRIFLDKSGPETSFQINNGSTYTNTENVTLSITAKDNYSYPSKMYISVDGTNWIEKPFSEKLPFTLPLGDGKKDVYVKVADALGNASKVVKQTIVLDKTVPYGSISINNGAQIVPSKKVDLSITLGDKLSGINKVKIIDGDKEYELPTIPKDKIAIPWELSGKSNGQVTLVLVDNAGNVARIESNQVMLATLNITGFELLNVVNPSQTSFKPIKWAFEPQKMMAGGNIEFAIYYDLYRDERIKSSRIEGKYTIDIVGDNGYHYTSSNQYVNELPLPEKGFSLNTLIPENAPRNAKVYVSSHLKATLQTDKGEVVLEDSFPDKNGKAHIGIVDGFIKDRIKFNEIR
ncbi:hypothetical protein [Bacillus paranthracis]|uniref:hypothetical protein n=1 Tax=Bacillus paranthracis TaxID=2026186 RepID=UPI002FDC4FB6|nr:hypothetical protein [Bacillus paranthracis]